MPDETEPIKYKNIQEEKRKSVPIADITQCLVIWGVGVVLIGFTLGVSIHILSTGPKWRQRVVQGITDQNTYCFSKNTLNKYGSLLVPPAGIQAVILVLLCCWDCCSNKLIFLLAMITSGVALLDGSFFLKLANENRAVSTLQCPGHYKGGAVRVDGFFLTPMAISMAVSSTFYIMVIVRSIRKRWEKYQSDNYSKV